MIGRMLEGSRVHGPSALSQELRDVALQLGDLAAGSDFRGPDPYDGLWWNWPGPLVGGRRRRQAMMQLHARSPVDIRRVYRRAHPLIPKALGIFGSVGVRAARLNGAKEPPSFAARAVSLLDADRSAGAVAWGYHWDMQTRWSFYPAGSPNVVATVFAASGLLEVAAGTDRPELAERAQRAARWILEELWVEPEGYFSYHPGRPVNIHNANLLGAWLVHALFDSDPAARDRVARAVERTLAAQRRDGSWPYGEGDHLSWADSFHTGYVLSCLERLSAVDSAVADSVARGAGFYRRFFGDDGSAQLWAHKRFPRDGHSAGTGLTTLAALRRRDLIEPEMLEQAAAHVLRHGLHRGHAIHRQYRWARSTVRYIRWCDAHVALGLVDAAGAMLGATNPAPRSALSRSAARA
jgi:hypothetical protein